MMIAFQTAIKTIKTIMDETGKLPENLVLQYREDLEQDAHSGDDFGAQRCKWFYERLSAECPEALKYFA